MSLKVNDCWLQTYKLCSMYRIDAVLNQMNPVCAIPLYFFMIHFKIIFLFAHRFDKWSHFVAKTVSTPVIHSSHSWYPLYQYHGSWFGSLVIWPIVQIMKLLLMSFSPYFYKHLLGPNVLLNTLCSNTLKLCCSLNVRPSFTFIQENVKYR